MKKHHIVNSLGRQNTHAHHVISYNCLVSHYIHSIIAQYGHLRGHLATLEKMTVVGQLRPSGFLIRL